MCPGLPSPLVSAPADTVQEIQGLIGGAFPATPASSGGAPAVSPPGRRASRSGPSSIGASPPRRPWAGGEADLATTDPGEPLVAWAYGNALRSSLSPFGYRPCLGRE